MVNRLIHTTHHLNCKDRPQILCIPVFLGRSFDRFTQNALGFWTATKLNLFFRIKFSNAGQEFFSNRFINQEAFHGITHSITVCFCIQCDWQGFLQVSLCLNKDMAIAIQMLDHRNTRFIADAFNQAFSTTWHNHVNIFSHGDQMSNSSTVRCVNHLYGMFRQA